MRLFAISFKLGLSSGIRELIVDEQFHGSFHLCKLKTSAWKTLLCSVTDRTDCQVRCQCWQNERNMLNFFVFISRSITTHIASFLFSDSCFSSAQIAKISVLALIVASLDNHLVLHAHCNCRTFLFIVVWCNARQAGRNHKTVKHFHNCVKVLWQFRATYCTNLRQYSNSPKRGCAHDNYIYKIYNFHFCKATLPTSEPENYIDL